MTRSPSLGARPLPYEPRRHRCCACSPTAADSGPTKGVGPQGPPPREVRSEGAPRKAREGEKRRVLPNTSAGRCAYHVTLPTGMTTRSASAQRSMALGVLGHRRRRHEGRQAHDGVRRGISVAPVDGDPLRRQHGPPEQLRGGHGQRDDHRRTDVAPPPTSQSQRCEDDEDAGQHHGQHGAAEVRQTETAARQPVEDGAVDPLVEPSSRWCSDGPEVDEEDRQQAHQPGSHRLEARSGADRAGGRRSGTVPQWRAHLPKARARMDSRRERLHRRRGAEG